MTKLKLNLEVMGKGLKSLVCAAVSAMGFVSAVWAENTVGETTAGGESSAPVAFDERFLDVSALPEEWSCRSARGSANPVKFTENGVVVSGWTQAVLTRTCSIDLSDPTEMAVLDFETYSNSANVNSVIFLASENYSVAIGNSYDTNPKIVIGDFEGNAAQTFVNYQQTALGTVPGNQKDVATADQIQSEKSLSYHLRLCGTSLTGWVKDSAGNRREFSYTIPANCAFTVIGAALDGDNGAVGLRRVKRTETPISADETLFDITFKNNTADYGHFDYSSVSGAKLQYDTTPTFYTVEGDPDATSVYLKHHPYISGAGETFTALKDQDFSVVVVGQMSPSRQTMFINIGRSNDGRQSFLIATTANGNEVTFATTTNGTIDRENAVTTKVPKAATSRHAYVITKVGDKMTVFVDGTQRGTPITLPSGFKLGNNDGGIQVGSGYGNAFGGITDKSNPNYCANVTDANDTGYVTLIRVFGYALTTAQQKAIADRYGAKAETGDVYRRTLEADGNLSADGAWARGEETAAVPAQDGDAHLVVAADARLTLNAAAALTKLTVDGPGILTLAKDAAGSLSVVDAVLNTPVVMAYGVWDLSGTAIQFGENGALAFDLRDYDISTALKTTYVWLTGLLNETEKVTATLPPATFDQKAELVYQDGAYAMKISPLRTAGSEIVWVSGYWGTQQDEDKTVAFAHNGNKAEYVDGDIIALTDGSTPEADGNFYCGSGMRGKKLAIHRDVSIGTPSATGKTFGNMTVAIDDGKVVTLVGPDGNAQPAVIADNSSVSGGQVRVNGTLQVATGSTLQSAVTGSGRVEVAISSGMPTFNPSADWTGTFVIPPNNYNGTPPHFIDLNRYGTANSTIVLNNLTGNITFADGATKKILPKVVISGDSVNLSSAEATTIAFAKLSGSGTLTIASANVAVTVDALEDFTGKITGETAGVTLPSGKAIAADGTIYDRTSAKAATAVLRISEIMPKPVDKPVSAYYPATLERMDPNGLESGWVELENTSESDYADLADYKFLRVNRGKATSKGDYGNFPSVRIEPKAKFVFWTSERYSNSADMTVSAWATADANGARPKLYGNDLGNMLVWPDKVNPKKSPFVRLVYTGGETEEIVDTVVIPSDVPEGHSVIVNPVAEGNATVRYLTDRPTRGTANTKEGLVALGPNAGPLYELSSQKKHDSANEFARNAAPAKPGEDYPITFSLNPTMSPTEVGASRAEDAITAITLVYRAFGGEEKTVQVNLATDAFDAADWGHTYQTAIPAADLPEAGGLVQWKFKVTDASGNVWTTPSFHNKDDGYEWYGTIVEPTAHQVSASLPTWHMFAAGDHLTQMDKDKERQDLAKVPNYARVAIYDQSTSNYYDYVRIDLRGNTSAQFQKKSHGLRFAKAHPLTMTDCVTGQAVEEVRKSSLIGEPADPSYMRQMVAFWLWNRMGNKVPFDFPVRCNMNGAFYQLAFHSERFTDELIEDFYGLDKFGYGYKNVGTFKSGTGTTSGSIEKKTPDDGNESDISVLQGQLRAKITDAQKVSGDVTGENTTGLDNAALTKFVVQKFNLPAWLNYLASARITHEADDVWANISAYYDNAEMKEGVRGTDTWMPLGYDFNLSFGQHYKDYGTSQFKGIFADQDWFKAHPFYGGNRVRCYSSDGKKSLVGNGNDAVESVWQSAKFRRLYLRRLRTLMDQELKAPGTAEADVPFMAEMRRLAALLQADVVLDKAKWPHENETSNNFKAINNWTAEAWPTTMDAGIDEIWNSYVVPRQTHLYITHAATNTAKAVGYASNLNAGIPAEQSALDDLKAGLSAEAVEGVVVIRNTNAETIDLSGWKVSGPVSMTLPPGTVLDQGTAEAPGEVFVVTDRRAYVAAHETSLTDQVIVGNATAGSADSQVGLDAADGTIVISADKVFTPNSTITGAFDVPVRLASAGKYTLQGTSFNAGLTLSEGGLYTIKNDGAAVTNSASSVSAAAASIVFTGKGAFRLAGAKTSGTLMEVNDLFVSNGVFSVESKAATPGTCAVVVNGNFAVEDKGTVSLKLTKNADTGRGIFMSSKKMFCRIGDGGTFTAEVNGPGAQAIHGEKGSVDLAIEPGATVSGMSSGTNVRFFKMAGHIVVTGGTVNLTATGEGAELLSAEKSVKISGGALSLVSTDDCVSAQTSIEVSGGTLVGQSSANDVLDSNGTIAISGGTLVLLATADGHEGLDYQPAEAEATPAEHWLRITGGIVYATGGANAEVFAPEDGGQPYAKLGTAEAAGIVMVTADGTIHGFVKPAGARTVLVSVPALAGEAAEAAAFSGGATMVLDPYYATWLARARKVAPGTTLDLAATDAAGAAEEIKKIDLVLSEEDEAAGLAPESLVVVAEPVSDAAGAVTGYRAVVAVNPERVSAPVVGGTDDGSVKPIELQSAADDSGSKVSLGISNAVRGLWYGYEVSDAPNGVFAVDVPSFARATKAVLTITGSKRTAQSGFFRVLVLPARPQEPASANE